MSMCIQSANLTNSCTNMNGSPSMNWMSSQATFPVRLHAMLAEVEQDPVLSRMVSWRPHGRLFVVEDREGFMKHILPNWFTMNSYASFQRQCNMYGFRRMTSGPDKGGYYHELFLRGNPVMAARIPRIKYKGTGPRKPACPEEEPDFYKMPTPFRETPTSQAYGGCTLSLGALLAGGGYQAPANTRSPLATPSQCRTFTLMNVPSSDEFHGRSREQPQSNYSHHQETFDELVDTLDYSIAAVDDALEAWELELEPIPL